MYFEILLEDQKMIDERMQNYYAKLKYELQLSDLQISYAKSIHAKFLKTSFSNGRDPCVVATSCLYLACRITYDPRTIKAISEVGQTPRKDIARCYRLLVKNHDQIGFVLPPHVHHRVYGISSNDSYQDKWK